jgi:hypothetical protein
MARYTRQADVAERRARILQLRIEQRTWAEIAATLGVTQHPAQVDYQRALEAFGRQQAEHAPSARDLEMAKLDALEAAAWRVLRTRHITVQHGKIVGRYTGVAKDPETGAVVRDGAGEAIPVFEEIEDDAPVLQAIDRLVRIAQRRATLTGIDAPAKVEVSDARRAAIEQLAGELASGRLGNLDPEGKGSPAGDAAAGTSGPDPA